MLVQPQNDGENSTAKMIFHKTKTMKYKGCPTEVNTVDDSQCKNLYNLKIDIVDINRELSDKEYNMVSELIENYINLFD